MSAADSLHPVGLGLMLQKKHNLEAKQNRSSWLLVQWAQRAGGGSLDFTGPQRTCVKQAEGEASVPDCLRDLSPLNGCDCKAGTLAPVSRSPEAGRVDMTPILLITGTLSLPF